MKKRLTRAAVGVLPVTALVTGCGGGGTHTAGSVTPLFPSTASPSAQPPGAAPASTATITLRIPRPAGLAAGVRGTKVVPSGTQTVVVEVDPYPTGDALVQYFTIGSANAPCAAYPGYLQCTISATAPVGYDRLYADLFAPASAPYGTPLATSRYDVPTPINVGGAGTTATISTRGVVSALYVAYQLNETVTGNPNAVPLYLLDAANQPVQGPIANPFTLAEAYVGTAAPFLFTYGGSTASTMPVTYGASADGVNTQMALTIAAASSGATSQSATIVTTSNAPSYGLTTVPPSTAFGVADEIAFLTDSLNNRLVVIGVDAKSGANPSNVLTDYVSLSFTPTSIALGGTGLLIGDTTGNVHAFNLTSPVVGRNARNPYLLTGTTKPAEQVLAVGAPVQQIATWSNGSGQPYTAAALTTSGITSLSLSTAGALSSNGSVSYTGYGVALNTSGATFFLTDNSSASINRVLNPTSPSAGYTANLALYSVPFSGSSLAGIGFDGSNSILILNGTKGGQTLIGATDQSLTYLYNTALVSGPPFTPGPQGVLTDANKSLTFVTTGAGVYTIDDFATATSGGGNLVMNSPGTTTIVSSLAYSSESGIVAGFVPASNSIVFSVDQNPFSIVSTAALSGSIGSNASLAIWNAGDIGGLSPIAYARTLLLRHERRPLSAK